MRRMLPLLAILALLAVGAVLLRMPAARAPALQPTPQPARIQAAQPTRSAPLQPTRIAPTAAPPTPTVTPTATPTATPTVTPTVTPTATPVLTADGWLSRSTAHFRLFALPQSDAARDLDALALVAETGYLSATTALSPTGTISISVYLVPRVFWQGGVAYGSSGPLIISHLDRNYTAITPWNYLTHETVHALGAGLIPAGVEVGGLLGEGIAVRTTGGHYGPEPYNAWAAALARTPSYIPLCVLRDDFYAAQHEVAYLEAASYTDFLIERYGHDSFIQMYKLQQPQRGHPEIDTATFCAADNQQVAAPLSKTNAVLEQEWRDWLAQQAPTAADRTAVALQSRFFDTMRSYQERFDPPARLIPPPPAEWTPDIRATMSAAPADTTAIVLETMLLAARHALLAGDESRAIALLEAIEAAVSQGSLPNDPLTSRYNAITKLLLQTGYQPAELDVFDDHAQALVQLPDRSRYQVSLQETTTGWQLVGWDRYQP